MNKIYKVQGKNLVIKVPMKAMRANPYHDLEVDEMDNIIGLYEGEYNNGLAYRIDMDYKGKPDQWSDYFFKLNGSKEEFEAMCIELEIEGVYDIKHGPLSE